MKNKITHSIIIKVPHSADDLNISEDNVLQSLCPIPECLEKAKTAKQKEQALNETGFSNAKDWKEENWGVTKEILDCEVDSSGNTLDSQIKITFELKEGAEISPALDYFSESNPDVMITYEYLSEPGLIKLITWEMGERVNEEFIAVDLEEEEEIDKDNFEDEED